MIQRYIKSNITLIGISCIPMVIVGVMAPLKSWVMQRVIDCNNQKEFAATVLFAILFNLFLFLFEWLFRKSEVKTIKVLEQKIRYDVMDKIFGMSEVKFRRKDVSYYISKFTNDIRAILEDGFENLFEMGMQMIFLIVAIVYLLSIDPIILLVVVVVSGIQFIVPKVLKAKIAEKKKRYIEENERYLGAVKEVLTGYRVIRTYGIKDKILPRYNVSAGEISQKSGDSKAVLFFGKALLSLCSNLTLVLVLSFSMALVLRGRITIGQVVAVTNSMNFIMTPCNTLMNGYIKLKSLTHIEKEIDSFFEETHEDKQVLQEDIERIRLHNISKQINDSFGLADVNMEFEKNQKYAIVGKSGSGKSSLINLLAESGNPYQGSLQINDYELTDLERESVLKRCPICYQQSFVFQDSILNNITLYGDYEPKDIEWAVREAGLETLIQSLPEGLNTQVDGSGSNFSGGEVQRIALARALLRKPRFMILDEITAGLDNETAYTIEKKLLENPQLTIINITHRYHTELMARYDRIYVIDKGKVVEEGNFTELMEKKRSFYDLFRI